MGTIQGSSEAPWPKAIFIVAWAKGSVSDRRPRLAIGKRVLWLKAIFNLDSGRKEMLVQPLSSMCQPKSFNSPGVRYGRTLCGESSLALFTRAPTYRRGRDLTSQVIPRIDSSELTVPVRTRGGKHVSFIVWDC